MLNGARIGSEINSGPFLFGEFKMSDTLELKKKALERLKDHIEGGSQKAIDANKLTVYNKLKQMGVIK